MSFIDFRPQVQRSPFKKESHVKCLRCSNTGNFHTLFPSAIHLFFPISPLLLEFQTFGITMRELLNLPDSLQSIIIRSLMLDSLVEINGGQVPRGSRRYGVQIHPALHPVEADKLFFSAWLARTGIRPVPESFRLIKQRCFQVRQNCLPSSIQDDGALSDIEMKHLSKFLRQNQDCSSISVKSTHSITVNAIHYNYYTTWNTSTRILTGFPNALIASRSTGGQDL